MPASNPGNGARAVQPPKRKLRVKRPKSPAPTRIAQQQEQQYRSQGAAVKKEASRQRVRVKAPAKRTPAAKDTYRAPQEQALLSQAHAVRLEKDRQRGKAQGVPVGVSLAGDLPTQQDLAKGARVSKRNIRAARIKALTDRQSQGPGRGVTAIKRELEGKGVLAKIGSALGNRAAENIRKYGPGGMPPASLSASTPATDLAVRTAKDLANFPAQVVPSVYVPAAGAVEAVQGRPARLKAFLKSIDKTDPVYNTIAAGVDAAGGDSKAAKARFHAAWAAAKAHPGFTALEVMGAGKGADAAAGRVGRTGALSKRVKAATATEGAPKVVEGTNLTEPRVYPKGVVQGRVARRQERTARGNAQELRAEADKIRATEPDHARELDAKANRVDPDRVQAGEIRRRVNERVDANEALRRIGRADVQHQVHQALKGVPRRAHPIVSLVAQGITHATEKDLRAYRDELAGEHDRLTSGAHQRVNRELRARIDKALQHPEDLPKVAEAARRYTDVVKPLQQQLVERGMLDSAQAERAAVTPYAVRRMGATHDPEQGLVDVHGKPLSTEAIRAHMAENGVPEPAFVTQAPNTRGARNFYVSSDRAQGVANRRRTGAATRQGTFDIHPDTLTEGAARARGLADAADGFRGWINEMGARGSSGKLKTVGTRRQAEHVRDELNALPGGHEFTIIRVNPFGGRKEQLQSLLDQVNADAQAGRFNGDESPAVLAMEEALRGGDGPYALVPRVAVDQQLKHLRANGPGAAGKAGQVFFQAFRRSVLGTSPTWITGDVVEGAFRAGLHRAGVRSFVTGRRTLKQLEKTDPQAAREAAVRTVSGGHFSSAERQVLHRTAEQFAGTNLEGMATALGKFWRTPGPKQAAWAWNRWTHWVFNTVNGSIERGLQTAILGAELRRSPLMSDHFRKLSQAAIADAARGLKNTESQVRFGRAIDRAYGRYNKLGPAERQFLVTYTPFVRWAANATRFVVDVLPRDHPVVTALLASAENASQDWLGEHGLVKFGPNAAPDFLMGSIPVHGGSEKLRLSRYLPFGIGSDPLGTAAGQVLPQAGAVLNAMQGRDWLGRQLKGRAGGEPDDLDKLLAAAHALATASVPILGQGERVKQKGVAALNPFAPTAPKKNETRLRSVGAYSSDTYSSPAASGSYSDPNVK